MRIYCSGPMTGHPDLNRPAFDAAEKRLTAQGHFVINPHRISEPFGTAAELSASFREYYRLLSNYGEDAFDNSLMCLMAKYRTRVARAVMDADLAAVRSCDAIYPLRVWVSSSRLQCGINGDFGGTSATAYAWFVWQKGYKGDTILKWFN